jgi:hypothetical protein
VCVCARVYVCVVGCCPRGVKSSAESAGGTAALNAEYLAVYGWLSLGVIALLVVQVRATSVARIFHMIVHHFPQRVVIVWTQLRGARTFHEK